MKKCLGILCLIMLSALPGYANTPGQDDSMEMLVLSELEERIAGKMAFYTIREMLQENGYRVIRDQHISQIGRNVAKFSDRPKLGYSFYVIEGEAAPQAMSLPGGYVLLSRTLLDTVCRTDDDTAFIIGHEIAHAALRHYADYKLQGDQQVAYVKHLIDQQGMAEGEQPLEYAEELHDILFPYIVKIRRIKEMEADQFGALYALRAGYKFSASLLVLLRLRSQYGEHFRLEKEDFTSSDDSVETQKTHPTLSERIHQLRLFRIKAIEVAKLFPEGREALDRGHYEEASFLFETILSLFPQSRTARIGLGVAYHLRYWDSSEGDDFLLAYPGSLEIENLQLLRGSADWETLHQAIEEYRTVLEMEPGNTYAVNNLGVALAELNHLQEAEDRLRESLRLESRDFILFNLALVLYQKSDETGQEELKHEALALMEQYVNMTPQDHVAVKYLQEWK